MSAVEEDSAAGDSLQPGDEIVQVFFSYPSVLLSYKIYMYMYMYRRTGFDCVVLLLRLHVGVFKLIAISSICYTVYGSMLSADDA